MNQAFKRWRRHRHQAVAVLLLMAMPVMAAPVLPLFNSNPTPGGGQAYTLAIESLILMTALTFIPAAILSMTAFTRIAIVLGLLRQALGTMQSPPNQVLVGLSLFLTYFVMAPTLDKVYAEAYKPFSQDAITLEVAAERASLRMKEYMLRQTRESDLALFVRLSRTERPKVASDLPLKVVVPAHLVSELKTAFQIGFLLFIPFLIIDFIVSTVLMGMGMMMLSPMTISLPLKLMLFILVDGWNLTIGSLVSTFAVLQ